MKINAINANYLPGTNVRLKRSVSSPQMEPQTILQNMSVISFRSGNPRHIAHVVAEEPLFGFNGGGVGTVVNDYNFLDKDVDKIQKGLC